MEEDGTCIGGDRCSSDVIVNLRTSDGRDDRFYAHSAVLSDKCRYFSSRLSEDYSADDSADSRRRIELVCSEGEVDHYVIFLRLLYAEQKDRVADLCYNVRNAIGVVKVAYRLGCDEVARECMQYMESMPWEESEEEEILKTLPPLASAVHSVFARLQPVDPAVLRQVFVSAFTVATGDVSIACFPKLKASAQEQVEYMLVEDDDAPLVTADGLLKSNIRNSFSALFTRFCTCFKEDVVSEDLILDKLSDLVWATSRILPRVNLVEEIVLAWLGASEEMIHFLDDARLKSSFWSSKLRVMEITCKVLEGVGYGTVVLAPMQRTGLIKLWLPYIRKTMPVLEVECRDETSIMDGELCQNIEAAITSLILSLPSEDQAEILSDWLRNENAGYPDLTEAFEVWCYRSKAAKRRLSGVTLPDAAATDDM